MYKLLERALTGIKDKNIEECTIKYVNKKMQLWFREDDGFEYLYHLYYYNDLIICDLISIKDTRTIEI